MNAKTAVVTGAARGIGYAIVTRLLNDGWNVAMCDLQPTLDENRKEIAALGSEVFVYPCDVSDENSVKNFAAEVITRFGSIHALVNNAGIGGPSTSVTETSLEDFEQVLSVNITGTFLMCKHVAPHIAREESGRIINFGSIYGMQGVAGGAGYCASKGAVASLTHSLALELAPKITVNTIAPGQIISQMYVADQELLAQHNGRSLEAQLAASRNGIPAQRQGEGKDIANAVAWLLSPDAAYVTGQTLSVNGGVLLT
ncbi:MAG: glucose 1-dehydrogenase [Actinobacteria bacterium]|uniref:Unannotated protein n=1 Tax=freshwater metagenome TaxID=449393 RepID=A0A6J5YLI0_9ZZZZ|nr:glucose 1-dehydrogenase [Actinomycetota bacterium]